MTHEIFKAGAKLGLNPTVTGGEAGPRVPNYVSRDELHLEPGVESGKTQASEKVPYKTIAEAGSTPRGAELERRQLNAKRDARTNLGRGKAGKIVTE